MLAENRPTRRTISLFGVCGYYLTRTQPQQRDDSVSAHPPRLHLVTPAIVARTLARLGTLHVLSESERTAMERLTVERRRRDWLAGRIAAKRALRAAARDCGDPVPAYRAISVSNDAAGAPCFTVAGRPELARRWNISIAHTDGAALAALADTERTGTVGVDIERTRPLSASLIRYALTADEARRFTDDRRTPAPLIIWAVKEAVLKATRGTCTALREIELTWWGGARPVTARLVGARSPAAEIVVTHRAVGVYTVAIALCRGVGRRPLDTSGRPAAAGPPATRHAAAVA